MRGVVASAVLGPGDKIGRFRIEAVLGGGGMGRVYGAHDELLNRRVAVKLLHSGDPSTLVDEARALAALRHPNIVTIFELAHTEHGPLVVMEWINGRGANALLTAGPVPMTSVSTIVNATASAIEALHAAGWVHDDVKPSNILIERGSARVVLADLGLAQRIDVEPSVHLVRGTPEYLAPEAARGGFVPAPLRTRRDVYALAASAFELLTGAPPFVGDDFREVLRAQIESPIPRADDMLPELGWRVHRVLAGGLAKRPEDRYATPTAFATALSRAISRRRSPLRLLVVDDDSDHRELYASALARHFRGAAIEAVSDGETGFHAAAATSPDLAIVDVAMPRMNGVELVASLRATDGLEHLPIIVASGQAVPGDRELLRELGVHRILEKPIELRELVEEVRLALELPVESGYRLVARARPRPFETLPEIPAPDVPPRKPVLIVEDDDELREGLTFLLQRRGASVIAVANGKEALASIDPDAPPGLILLDLMMPVMDGWRFRLALNMDPRLASIPVALVSGISGLDVESKRLGAVDFFAKPVDYARLYGLVDRLCAA